MQRENGQIWTVSPTGAVDQPQVRQAARLNLPGYAQHVIQRGNNRKACFYGEADYKAYLAFLKEAAIKHHVAIHAFVLMTNRPPATDAQRPARRQPNDAELGAQVRSVLQLYLGVASENGK
jgi:hypothetical protein